MRKEVVNGQNGEMSSIIFSRKIEGVIEHHKIVDRNIKRQIDIVIKRQLDFEQIFYFISLAERDEHVFVNITDKPNPNVDIEMRGLCCDYLFAQLWKIQHGIIG